SPGGIGMYTGASAMAVTSNVQRSQDTLYALAADTGGKALQDFNDLASGIVQAQKAGSSYYLVGYYTANQALDGKFRRGKNFPKRRRSGGPRLPPGLLRRQAIQQVQCRRQRTAARRGAHAGRSDYPADRSAGGELLSAKPGRVFRAGHCQNPGERTGAGQTWR